MHNVADIPGFLNKNLKITISEVNLHPFLPYIIYYFILLSKKLLCIVHAYKTLYLRHSKHIAEITAANGTVTTQLETILSTTDAEILLVEPSAVLVWYLSLRST